MRLTWGPRLRHVLSWLLAVVFFVTLMAWSAGCMYVALRLAEIAGLADEWERALAVVAAAAGLWFALWSAARLTGHRL